MSIQKHASPILSGDSQKASLLGFDRWVLIATVLGSSMAFVDGTVVNIALSALQSAFHVTGPRLQWIVEAYTLSLASLLLLGGSFGDLYGRRRVFLIGVALFALSSVACGAEPNFGVMIVSRAVQGIGGALLVAGSLSLISSSFPEETRGCAIGIWSGATAIAVMVGPVLGGWLVQHASWRLIFLLNVPLALSVIAISLLKVPESKNPLATKPDWVGAVLAAAGLWMCTFALIERAHRSMQLLALGLMGLICLGAFLQWERRTAQPMVPLRLFCSTGFSIANVMTLLVYSSLTGTLYYLPLHLIQVQHYSSTHAGASFLPISILISLLSRFSGRIVERVGPMPPLVVGTLLSAAGYALLLRTSTTGGYWMTVFPGICVLGLGLAVMVVPLTTTVMNSVEEGWSGTASGINNAISNVASLLAISLFGVLFSRAFEGFLGAGLQKSTLSVTARQAVYAHRLEMGGMDPVAGIPGSLIVNAAFLHSLHFVFVTASVLSVLAAGAAFFLRDSNTMLGAICAKKGVANQVLK